MRFHIKSMGPHRTKWENNVTFNQFEYVLEKVKVMNHPIEYHRLLNDTDSNIWPIWANNTKKNISSHTNVYLRCYHSDSYRHVHIRNNKRKREMKQMLKNEKSFSHRHGPMDQS